MKAYSLVTIPSVALFESNVLLFKSYRTGFPTTSLHVTINAPLNAEGISVPAWQAATEATQPAMINMHNGKPWHHAEWIRNTLERHAAVFEDEPAIILDPDQIFWQNVEGWEFTTFLAGYHVPLMWNDFSKSVSFERLHTSFLWVSSPKTMLETIKKAYPPGFDATGAYAPVDPFMPRVQFIKGEPFFWDSTAGLYNMLGGTSFGAKHLAAFDHLNSAAFYDVMHERLENKRGFEMVHKDLVKTPEKLRGLWGPVVDPYYAQKHQQALSHLASLSPSITRALTPIL